MFKQWLYGYRDEWAELHGYVHRCPICGSGYSDTEGPCSDYCEDKLRRYEPDPDDQED